MKWTSWLASLFLESPQERQHRVRQQQATAARERLRRNIEYIKARRLREVRAELNKIGEDVIAEAEKQGEQVGFGQWPLDAA